MPDAKSLAALLRPPETTAVAPPLVDERTSDMSNPSTPIYDTRPGFRQED